MQLAERTVLVTGAGSGIGRETALRCAAEGATVVVTDVDEDGGRETADRLREETDAESEFSRLDVRDEAAFEATVAAVEAEHDGLDVLVNNAGVAHLSLLEDTSVETRDRVIGVNAVGVWNGCRAAIPGMKRAGRGSIVNVASAGGLLGTPRLATYSLAKAGVVNFTRALAGEAGPHGVRVNAVCPGTIETPMATAVMDKRDDPAAARAQAEADHALARLGRPGEVASCVVFLASDEASFVTGHALAVDGGSSAVLRFR